MQILKEGKFSFKCLKNCINDSIEETRVSLSSLKLGNITPIFKKDYPLDKSNYNPVSILPLPSRGSKRINFNKLSQHFKRSLNSVFCSFRKAHTIQHTIFKLLHSCQKALDSAVLWIQLQWTYQKLMTVFQINY